MIAKSYRGVLLLLAAHGSIGADGPVVLPSPRLEGPISLEEAIFRRRSVRAFTDRPLTLKQTAQLLWAAGGKTADAVSGPAERPRQRAGSAHWKLYLVAGSIEGLKPGIYRPEWRQHVLRTVAAGDRRRRLTDAALWQSFIAHAPASIAITALVERSSRKYGDRGVQRYVPMDAGHAAENILLQAVALGLGCVPVGAFDDDRVKQVLESRQEQPLYIIPVGWPGD